MLSSLKLCKLVCGSKRRDSRELIQNRTRRKWEISYYSKAADVHITKMERNFLKNVLIIAVIFRTSARCSHLYFSVDHLRKFK